MKAATFACQGRGRLLAALLAALAALLLALGLAGVASAAKGASFPDVPEGSWYASWVEKASNADLMTGYDAGPKAGLFGPDDTLTRAQAATVLWRMAGRPQASASAGFPDVAAGSWYAAAVDWCAEVGVVTGYEGGANAGRFVPDGEVTRAELAAMAWRWAKWSGLDVTAPDPAAFKSTTDWQSVESWAGEALTWTAAAGVLSGVDNPDGNRTLNPAGTATRAQAAKVFVVLSGSPDAPKATHTVTFETNGGSAVASQTVVHGKAAEKPEAPARAGYAFAGWYSDKELTAEYDFTAAVTADITLYAKWAELQAYAVLYSDGTLCLQLGDDTDASHGSVAEKWEWDGKTAPWSDAYASVKTVVARDRISLSGDCTALFTALTECESMDLEALDVSHVKSFAWMFNGCFSLTSLKVSSWDMSSATSLKAMFYACRSLTSLDVSNWDVSDAADLSWVFSGCAFKSLDLSSWDVSSATDLSNMFHYCTDLESLNLSGWDVSKAENLGGMFYRCRSLKTLNLSGWNPSSATDLSWMFADCKTLASLDLSGWDTSKVEDIDSAFSGCEALAKVALGEKCGAVAEALGGPWYGADGTEYETIPAGVAGTFTKEKPAGEGEKDTQALAAAGLDVTFADVAAGEEGGLTFEKVGETSGPAVAAVTGEDAATDQASDAGASAGADQAADSDVPADGQPAAGAEGTTAPAAEQGTQAASAPADSAGASTDQGGDQAVEEALALAA